MGGGKENFAAAFDRMDVDGSGDIDVVELNHFLKDALDATPAAPS